MAVQHEVPYTVREVCELTGLSVKTVIRLFEGERGVIVVRRAARGKRTYRSFRIPRPVYQRVLRRLSIQ